MTYTTKTFSLISRADGTRLFGLCVAPEEPVAILQMAHGMAEHKERYLPFMEYLAERGFACFLHDHRGHGQSVDRPEKLGWFGPDGAENLVKDLRQMADYAVSKFPGLPLYLFGHSMGSLAVRCYLRAETWSPQLVYGCLERCYKALGDYKNAYEYACRQR